MRNMFCLFHLFPKICMQHTLLWTLTYAIQFRSLKSTIKVGEKQPSCCQTLSLIQCNLCSPDDSGLWRGGWQITSVRWKNLTI